MSNLNVETDKQNKILKVTLTGQFTSTETTKGAFSVYDKLMSQINSKEYSLLLDCTDCGVYEQSALQYLEQFCQMYTKAGFKHIVLVEAKNPIQNMQLKKVTGNVPGFPGVFRPTLSAAIAECKK